MLSKISILAILIGAMAFMCSPITASPSTDSHATRVTRAFNSLGTDFAVLEDVYDENAVLQFCRAGICDTGNVREILLPFHQALKSLKVEAIPLAGENESVMSLYWYNYMETIEGCGELTSGIATFEFNENGKVVKHLSLSDSPMECVTALNDGVMKFENAD